jgi:dCMP deaminase
MIINAGIETVVYEDGYADALAREMLKESGIKIERFSRKRRAGGRK